MDLQELIQLLCLDELDGKESSTVLGELSLQGLIVSLLNLKYFNKLKVREEAMLKACKSAKLACLSKIENKLPTTFALLRKESRKRKNQILSIAKCTVKNGSTSLPKIFYQAVGAIADSLKPDIQVGAHAVKFTPLLQRLRKKQQQSALFNNKIKLKKPALLDTFLSMFILAVKARNKHFMHEYLRVAVQCMVSAKDIFESTAIVAPVLGTVWAGNQVSMVAYYRMPAILAFAIFSVPVPIYPDIWKENDGLRAQLAMLDDEKEQEKLAQTAKEKLGVQTLTIEEFTEWKSERRKCLQDSLVMNNLCYGTEQMPMVTVAIPLNLRGLGGGGSTSNQEGPVTHLNAFMPNTTATSVTPEAGTRLVLPEVLTTSLSPTSQLPSAPLNNSGDSDSDEDFTLMEEYESSDEDEQIDSAEQAEIEKTLSDIISKDTNISRTFVSLDWRHPTAMQKVIGQMRRIVEASTETYRRVLRALGQELQFDNTAGSNTPLLPFFEMAEGENGRYFLKSEQIFAKIGQSADTVDERTVFEKLALKSVAKSEICDYFIKPIIKVECRNIPGTACLVYGNAGDHIFSVPAHNTHRKHIMTKMLRGLELLRTELERYHTDIKEANAFISPDTQQVRIGDMESVLADEGVFSARTTIGYVPPEALRGYAIGMSATLWSVGIVLLRSFLDEHEKNNVMKDLNEKLMKESVGAVSALDLVDQEHLLKIPKPWQQILASLLALDPNNRSLETAKQLLATISE